MKQLLTTLVAALLLLAVPLRAQVITPNQAITVIDSGTACVTAPAACAIYALDQNTGGVTINVLGTWTGTLTFEGTNNDGIWIALGLTMNLATGAQASTTTANGLFAITNAGLIKVRVRATGAITGSAQITAAKGLGFARAGPGVVNGAMTLNGPLLFSPDNTFDIGANGANRPSNIWAAGQISAKTFAVLAVSGAGYTWASGNRWASGEAPTIASGFGTSPTITGAASVFRVTLGNPVGQSGVVNFNLGVAFGSAPVVTCRDETTQTANPPTYTVSTTQVTITFTTAVAADKIGCTALGLP